MSDDRIKAALEAIDESIAGLTAQINENKRVANNLAKQFGLEPVYTDTGTAESVGVKQIRADQFANAGTPSTAARLFLKWRGQEKGSVDVDTIYDSLVKGGYTFGGGSPAQHRGGLKVALGKDGLIRRLSNDTYGLWEWYPNAKKTRGKKDDKSDESSEGSESEAESDATDEAGPTDPEAEGGEG